MKRKNVLRMGVIISIAMLLLISLLSSPVAAVVNFNAGTGTTTNPLGGLTPSAVITMSPPFTTPPGATTPLIVTFSYTFIDNNPPPATGSDHICTMIVTQTSPPGPPPVSASTGWTYLSAGFGPKTGVLTTTSSFTTTKGVTIVFTIEVYMFVEDRTTTNNDYDTQSTTITVLT